MQNDEKQEWRKAARRAMRKATREEAQRRYGTAAPVFNYRWEHVAAVVKAGLKLAQLTGADQEIVEAAAWLHDIAKDKGQNHPQAGAKYARRFLTRTDFPAEKIERVAEAIADHMGLWRENPLLNLESQVLWDADKLTKMGLTAAMHWTGLMLANGKPVTTADLIRNGRDADWQDKTVNSMHTAPARRAAQQRLEAFNRLWSQLEKELKGDDLVE
jgi:HD superfamily phosphodiesterase